MAHILSSLQGSKLDLIKVKRALLSCSDKTNLVDLATVLHKNNVELLSTGGTAELLRKNNIPVIDVSTYTGAPEILDGRVKTLHPKIHGGLLYVRGNETHERECLENDIGQIDVVIMNLYPFEATVSSGAKFEQCIENIDIGGPSMLRSSAKNHSYVTIISSPDQYSKFISELNIEHEGQTGFVSLALRKQFAKEAFLLSSKYDTMIANYFVDQVGTAEDQVVPVKRSYTKQFDLKYGCNPHQNPSGIFKIDNESGKMPFTVVNGAPGYINLLDALNAFQLVQEASTALNCVVSASFKHCSPAGVGTSLIPLTQLEANAYEIKDASSLTPTALSYVRARNADPMCSYGDFVAISHPIDVSLANILKVEVCDGIIAPGFEPEALEIIKNKKKGKFIVLQADPDFIPPVLEYREVYGCAFMQKRNDIKLNREHFSKIVTKGELTEQAVNDLILASIAIKYTQSNSIGYSKNGMMIGIGAGQQSRVDCIKLAGRKVSTWYMRQHPKVQNLKFKPTVKKQDRVNARVRYIEGDFTPQEYAQWVELFEEVPSPLTDAEKLEFMKSLEDVSLSSDAFFPFRDSIDHASKYGVKFIAQPGGSIADDEVLTSCDEYNMIMAFTNIRLFHH